MCLCINLGNPIFFEYISLVWCCDIVSQFIQKSHNSYFKQRTSQIYLKYLSFFYPGRTSSSFIVLRKLISYKPYVKVDDHHKGKLWNFVSHLHAPAPCTTCMQLPVYNIMQYSGVCSLNLFKMFLQNFICMGFNLIDILENPPFCNHVKEPEGLIYRNNWVWISNRTIGKLMLLDILFNVL